MSDQKLKLVLAGVVNDNKFTRAVCCATDLKRAHPDKFSEVTIVDLFEFGWRKFLLDRKRELRSELWNYEGQCLVFLNDVLLGSADDFLDWAMHTFKYTEFRPAPLIQTLSTQAYKDKVLKTGHSFVFLELTIKGESIGRLLIELYTNLCPKACENFRSLCIGDKGYHEREDGNRVKLHYEGSIFHRLVKNGWIQGGDIIGGRGNDGQSIYKDEPFEDECFEIKHTRPGVVGLANNSRHSNNSQFYVTLEATPFMDRKFQAIGYVVEGWDVLERLRNENTMYDRPINQIQIESCGQLELPQD